MGLWEGLFSPYFSPNVAGVLDQFSVKETACGAPPCFPCGAVCLSRAVHPSGAGSDLSLGAVDFCSAVPYCPWALTKQQGQM